MNNVVEYVENNLLINKDKIAIICEDEKITYQDLAMSSKRVGSFIANNLFNEPVVVFMDKSINALISFLGTIYAGCFYSLINPSLPKVRIQSIKETIKTKLVITDDENYALAKQYFPDATVKNINELKEYPINEEILKNALSKHISSDPLYINFTSGSTGNPKGVVISHQAVIDFIKEFTELFPFADNDVIANQAPLDFDVSVKDIYTSLKVGGTLLLIPKKYFSTPASLLDYLCEHKVTTLTWAVSALCLITTFHGLDYKVPQTVNKVLFSGEVMPMKHLKIWQEKLPNALFVNLYGPTEITCNCLYHVINKQKDYEKIPLGKPFPNERVFLLDENDLLITEKNKVGEICVSGVAVGLGYYNNKEITTKHFCQNPLNNHYNEIIYKTGDLAYIDAANDFYFMGRKDFQIKFEGHRIELEEIEKAMMDIPEIVRAVVIFKEEKHKIEAFYIGNIAKEEIKENLKQVLPSYMVPAKFMQVAEFPLNKNGKIDRQKLQELDEKKVVEV